MNENYTPEVKTYVQELFAAEDQVLEHVGEVAAEAGLPGIAVGPLEGRFLQVVAAAVGARRALEIGTLAGYSGIWIARGLGEDGQLVTLESDPRNAEVARENFRAAGLAERVEVRLGPALETLPELLADAPFGLVFIDADKESYPAYLDWALRLTRPGAAILAHNVYAHGDIVRSNGGERVAARREFNRRLAEDPRLASILVPLRDGLSLSIVREVAT